MDYQENQMAGASVGSARTQRAETAGQGPLDAITERIENATSAAMEIGNKLHAHADRVHGASGNKPLGAAGADRDHIHDRDRAPGAVPRIFEALGNLDQALSYLSEAAGRNSTLA